MMSGDQQSDSTTGKSSPANISDIIGEARYILGNTASDPMTQAFVTSILDFAERLKTDPQLSESPSYGSILEMLQTALERPENKSPTKPGLKAAELIAESELKAERFDDDWWDATRQSLYDLFEHNPVRAWEEWLTIYASALADWYLGVCELLVTEAFAFPAEMLGQLAILRDGTRAILDANDERAIDMLAMLVDMTIAESREPLLQASDRVPLMIMLGRIHLYLRSDAHEAKRRFELARELAPEDGRPEASLGEYYRLHPTSSGEKHDGDGKERVKGYVRAALNRPSGQLDAMIGMGLLLEDDQLWDASDDWYTRALNAVFIEDGRAAGVSAVSVYLDRHLRPVSGNVYLQAGRLLSTTDPEGALKAFDFAIDLSRLRAEQLRLGHDGAYTVRIGYRLKARLLQDLDRTDEAAESYYEAGLRFSEAGEPRIGIDLLQQARKLNRYHAPTCWELGDALRMESFRPDPPYVDKVTIDKSRQASDDGFALELPDATTSWVYTSRALINEQWGQLPSTVRHRAWWEAVTRLEQAILQDNNDIYRWTYLARFYGLLYLDISALDVARSALATLGASASTDAELLSMLESEMRSPEGDASPGMLAALEEYATALADVGQHDEALRAIELAQGDEPSAWQHALKASVLVDLGRYNEGIESIDRALAEEPKGIWYQQQRALCLRGLERDEDARAAFERIWQRYVEHPIGSVNADVANIRTYARTAFFLERYDEARDILEKFLHAPHHFGWSPQDASLLLGACYLALNDLQKAETVMRQGVRQATLGQTLVSFLSEEMVELERVLQASAHPAESLRMLTSLRLMLNERVNELQTRPITPEQELKRVLENLPVDNGSDDWTTWARAGAKAGLGRLHTEAGDWHRALEDYTALVYEDAGRVRPLFPEAGLGLRHVQVHAGVESITQGDLLDAVSHLRTALNVTLPSPWIDNLADLLVDSMAILTSARQARAMGNALRLLAKDPSLDHGQRRTIMSARREFSRTVYPRLIRQPLTALDPVSAEPVPVTRPLVLEVDVAWLPAMEHTPGIMRMIEIDFPETIRRVVESRGVTLPNLLIRPNYDLVRNGYRILINETPVGDGVLAPDERYCEDATEGRSLGFTGRVWRNPTEDIDGMWLEPAEWERAERAGIPLLDPYQYMMLHLESAVRARLSAFVGFQEVWDTVRLGSWADEEERLTFIERTLPDTTAKVRLLQVLRRLVDERIPVNSVRPILSAFADFNPGHPDINELAEEVRSALRASDSDPAKPTKLIGFSTAVEDRIAAWVRTANDKSFLAVPREDMESFDGLADEVSYRITDNPVPSVAITVHQRDLRRHVWQFWRGALQVLAEEELDEASVPLIDRIERIT